MSREAIKKYFDDGWDVIPYAQGEKGPRDVNWTTKIYTPEDFKEGANVGIRLSTLVDVDCDTPEAGKAALRLLPQTKRRHGRPSKPHSHFFFLPDRPITTQQFRDIDNSMLIELRGLSAKGTPTQTMIPPSTHPSGEQLAWDMDEEPAHIEADVLERVVKGIAIIAICARHWPTHGARHDARLALAGYLLRAGGTEDTVIKISETIAQLTGGNETDARNTAIHTAQKLAAGSDRNAWGGPKLAELLGADVVKALNKIVGCEALSQIEELNAKHAVLSEQGKTIVITEEIDTALDRSVIYRSSFEDIRNRYLHEIVSLPKGKSTTLGAYWLTHPARRQYDRIIFDPEIKPEHADPKSYNLWRGFHVQPQKGAWSLFREHLRLVVAGGSDPVFSYLEGWMARAVQRPGRPGEVAFVMRGRQGAGKGMVARGFGHIFGHHFHHVSQPRHLTGNFNAHLRDAVVVFADEAVWAGDRTEVGILKTLVTEPVVAVERKGKDVFFAKNVIHLIAASNNDWAWPAELDDRRGFIVDVLPDKIGDLEYFKAIRHELNTGGYEAMLHDLLLYDLSTFNHRKPPKTAALLEQKVLGMSPVQRWWFDKLKSGRIGWRDRWPAEIPKRELHDDYVRTMDKVGIHRKSTETELALFIQRYVPAARAKRGMAKVRVDFDAKGQPVFETQNTRSWALPSLKVCRENFEHELQSTLIWETDADDLDDEQREVEF